MSDLVDLGTTFANDRPDHVVRNENLLSDGLPGHRVSWLGWLTVWTRLRGHLTICPRLLRSDTIAWSSWSCRVRLGMLGKRLLGRAGHLWRTIRLHRQALGRLGVVPLVSVWMTILTSSWLWDVRHHLHAAWHHSRGAPTPRGIGRCRGAAETLSQLLDQCDGDIICGNVNGVGDSQNN